MTATDLKAEMQAIMAAKRQARQSHLSPQELLAYHAGELRGEALEATREHLASCRECSSAVLDMVSFPEVEPSDANRRLGEHDVARRWERLRERLREETPAPQAVREPIGRKRFRWRALSGSLELFRAAAAVLLVIAVGLAVALLSERRTAREGASPRLNLVIAELVPSEAFEERSEEGRIVLVPEDADGAVLTLALLDPRTYPKYELSFEEPSAGGTTWETSELQRNPEGFFTLELPRGFLPAGHYAVRLRGIEGDRRDLLATYRVELRYE